MGIETNQTQLAETAAQVWDGQSLRDKIYIVRGVQVMLDADLVMLDADLA